MQRTVFLTTISNVLLSKRKTHFLPPPLQEMDGNPGKFFSLENKVLFFLLFIRQLKLDAKNVGKRLNEKWNKERKKRRKKVQKKDLEEQSENGLSIYVLFRK